MKRDRVIRFRVSPEEKAAIVEKASVQSQIRNEALKVFPIVLGTNGQLYIKPNIKRGHIPGGRIC
jgi:hypothetical protein